MGHIKELSMYNGYMDGLTGDRDRSEEEPPHLRPYYLEAFACGQRHQNLNRVELIRAKAELTPLKARILACLNRADEDGLSPEAIAEQLGETEWSVRLALANMYGIYVTRPGVLNIWTLLDMRASSEHPFVI